MYSVVRVWPPAMAAYDLAGVAPPNPAEGLIIDRVRAAAARNPDGVYVLSVRGNIVNLKSAAARVPPLQFSLVKADGTVFDTWRMDPPRGEAATAMVMSELMPGMEMAGTDQLQHDCPPGHSHDSDPQGNSGSCPFAPAGVTQGCAALALLPATNTAVRLTTLEATSVLVMVVSTPRSFHEASIFHPPRA